MRIGVANVRAAACLWVFTFGSVAPIGPALAQKVIDLQPSTTAHAPQVVAPPSVDAGVANGDAKRAGSPSVGDGRANGVVKDAGAPSVGDGVANGVVKSTTVNQ